MVMNDDGMMFIHVFTHKDYVYPFETDGNKDWMARYFFTGGLMPSHDLFKTYDKDLKVVQDWSLNGVHYQKTLDAWLRRMESHKDQVISIFAETYGKKDAHCWYHRWRMFFMACSELFGYKDGTEWGVSHYLLKKKVNSFIVQWNLVLGSFLYFLLFIGMAVHFVRAFFSIDLWHTKCLQCHDFGSISFMR